MCFRVGCNIGANNMERVNVYYRKWITRRRCSFWKHGTWFQTSQHYTLHTLSFKNKLKFWFTSEHCEYFDWLFSIIYFSAYFWDSSYVGYMVCLIKACACACGCCSYRETFCSCVWARIPFVQEKLWFSMLMYVRFLFLFPLIDDDRCQTHVIILFCIGYQFYFWSA